MLLGAIFDTLKAMINGPNPTNRCALACLIEPLVHLLAIAEEVRMSNDQSTEHIPVLQSWESVGTACEELLNALFTDDGGHLTSVCIKRFCGALVSQPEGIQSLTQYCHIIRRKDLQTAGYLLHYVIQYVNEIGGQHPHLPELQEAYAQLPPEVLQADNAVQARTKVREVVGQEGHRGGTT